MSLWSQENDWSIPVCTGVKKRMSTCTFQCINNWISWFHQKIRLYEQVGLYSRHNKYGLKTHFLLILIILTSSFTNALPQVCWQQQPFEHLTRVVRYPAVKTLQFSYAFNGTPLNQCQCQRSGKWANRRMFTQASPFRNIQTWSLLIAVTFGGSH